MPAPLESDCRRHDTDSSAQRVRRDYVVYCDDPKPLRCKASRAACQLETSGPRIFVNVPNAQQIAVVDRKTGAQIATWRLSDAVANFPMALDEQSNRLFVGCRNRPRLRVVNAQTGKDIFLAKCSGDADDVFYDVRQDLVLVSGGEGFIDIFRANDKELVQINHIATSDCARTSLLLASDKKFLLAVPKRGGSPAALWVYNLQ